MKAFGLPALVFLLLAAVISRADEAPLVSKDSSLSFTGHATLHDFRGLAPDFHGSAQVDAADPNLVTGATIEIGAAHMTTSLAARDRKMLAWLHADTQPLIRFRLTKIVRIGGGTRRPTSSDPAQYTVSGELTLNGITRPLITYAAGWRTRQQLIITGGTRIDTTQFGLPTIREFLLSVDKNVDIRFHLAFELPAGFAK